jgi:hypothetical protein
MASQMIIAGDAPAYVGSEEEAGSGYGANSGILISPLYYIIPTQPLAGSIQFNPISINYNFNSPPSGYGVGKLKTSTGAYAREFAQCYVKGSASGPCAVVVNPTSATVNFPTLSRTYTHTATYTGRGVITQFGDTGALSISGVAPPTTLASGDARIVFP